jgi:predicted DNA-binding protein
MATKDITQETVPLTDDDIRDAVLGEMLIAILDGKAMDQQYLLFEKWNILLDDDELERYVDPDTLDLVKGNVEIRPEYWNEAYRRSHVHFAEERALRNGTPLEYPEWLRNESSPEPSRVKMTTTIPSDLAEQLNSFKKSRHLTKSAIVETAIRDYLSRIRDYYTKMNDISRR